MEGDNAMVRGIGIVVMAITILPLLKVGGMQLFKMEGPDSTEKILPRTIEVATIIILPILFLQSCVVFFIGHLVCQYLIV